MTLNAISKERLKSVNPTIGLIVIEAAKIIPLMVLEGHRNEIGQNKAFIEGKTKLKWPHGKHNSLPSLAVDLAPLYFETGKANIDWNDLIAFGRIMGCVQTIGHQMKVKLRFGMDWDGDFRSVNRDPDESFLDAPHVELVV
jgi:peptidoglycan L-alanyl-D-glutamate endopeptidase CwlK